MPERVLEGYRLSPQQKRLWAHQRSHPETSFRAQCAVLITGPLRPEFLDIAVENVVKRHESLRTGFHTLPEMTVPLQVIAGAGRPVAAYYDLSGFGAAEQERRAAELLCEMKRLPFDFTQAPLLRLSLLRLSAAEHLLLIGMPALCADTTTLKSLVREIGLTYGACLGEGEMPGEALQYVVISEWLNDLLETEEGKAGRDFWRRRGVAGLHDLKPNRRNTSADEPRFEPRQLSAELGVEVVRQIEEALARQSSLPLFLLACWQTLLFRLTEETEIVVGVADDGRIDEELMGVLGPLVKYLPVTTGIKGDERFSEILKRVGESFRESEEWQEGFTWEQSAGSVDAAKDAFFPTCFEFEEETAPHEAAGVTFSIREYDCCLDRFKLKLSCVRRRDALLLSLHYDPAFYDREEVAAIAGYFGVLVRDAANAPGSRVSKLSLLSAAQRHAALVGWNRTEAQFPSEPCLHELFEAQVERGPESIALSFEDEEVSYGELNKRANRLAQRLRRMGVGPEVMVGILMERSVEMVVALLGVLKAGGAYVPLDPEYPKQRLKLMLEDAQPAVLLTQERLREDFDAGILTVLCLDAEGDAFARESDGNAPSGVRRQNLAYVIYTSGSTGRPKGVMVSHRAICNHMQWMQAAFPLNEDDRVLQKTPFSFDASIWEFYAPLLSGARLVLARPGGHRDGAYLATTLIEHRITILQLVPSLLQMLLDEPGFGRCRSLRRVFCGGEALPAQLVRRFFSLLKAELHNLYGPTEACVDASSWHCRPDDQRGTVPIGRPIANTVMYVLDEHLEPAPVGVRAELYVGGAGLARSYFNSPALTAEKFIPHPFSHAAGERLYRTGDLACYLADGTLEYLGRVDSQVKVRGNRIELGEIEAILRQHPGVRDCVATVREDVPGERRLVAYVVPPMQEQAPTPNDLRSHAQQKLPQYMVPSVFVFIAQLPLSPNGKVDRRALPLPEQVNDKSAELFVEPRTPIEKTLSQILSEVLGVQRIGINHNFFDLGGHSLLAMQVISRVREVFDVEIPLRTLFEHPTLAQMAEMIVHGQVEQAYETDSSEISNVIEKVEQLSDEEVRALLGKAAPANLQERQADLDGKG
jgi:amino acid adenylation domain-containing protein